MVVMPLKAKLSISGSPTLCGGKCPQCHADGESEWQRGGLPPAEVSRMSGVQPAHLPLCPYGSKMEHLDAGRVM